MDCFVLDAVADHSGPGASGTSREGTFITGAGGFLARCY